MSNEQQKEISEEQLEGRTKAFADFFDLCEEQGVSVNTNEFRLISNFATREDGLPSIVNQGLNDLTDIKLESLTDRDVVFILKRARLGLKRVVEQRAGFSDILDSEGKPTGKKAGPYYKGRKQRRAIAKRLGLTWKQYTTVYENGVVRNNVV